MSEEDATVEPPREPNLDACKDRVIRGSFSETRQDAAGTYFKLQNEIQLAVTPDMTLLDALAMTNAWLKDSVSAGLKGIKPKPEENTSKQDHKTETSTVKRQQYNKDCDKCGVKILMVKTEAGWKAYSEDGSMLHTCRRQ